MGLEAACRVRCGRRVSNGRALLECDELIFRGEFRLRIPLCEIQAIQALSGELHVKLAGGVAIFELGPAAEEWALRITGPNSAGRQCVLPGGRSPLTRRQVVAAGALTAPLHAQAPRFAQRKTHERFWGAWILASYEHKRTDGGISYPMGADPVGRITYDGAGRMSAQLMRRDRPLFASGSRQDGTAHEIWSAFQGYIGYYGPYRLNEREKIVIHHVECASFPNWVGTDLVRHFDFDGDRLILRAAGPEKSEFRLIWVRAR